MIQKPTSLRYEPSLELLLITAKHLFLHILERVTNRSTNSPFKMQSIFASSGVTHVVLWQDAGRGASRSSSSVRFTRLSCKKRFLKAFLERRVHAFIVKRLIVVQRD